VGETINTTLLIHGFLFILCGSSGFAPIVREAAGKLRALTRKPINRRTSLARQFLALVYVCFITLLGSGCSTTSHLTKVPSPSEFKKPLQQLREEYPDLTRHESIGLFGTIFNMPEAQPLKDAWGEPHRTGFTSWMLLPTMWVSQPSNYWYWDFGGKTVTALIGRPVAFKLQPHVSMLKVEETK